MHVHLVGVSGTGMGALAMLYREQGHRVTGSDVAFDPPIGPALTAAGVECFHGYDAKHLDPAPDLTIVGNAIRRDNPEAAFLREASLKAVSMSGALRESFLANRRALIVTGTHGKTTTSAMCAWILHQAKLEPGYFIGGLPKNLPSGATAGSTRRRLSAQDARAPFVVEGDEYDAVYWDKKPKFFDYVGASDRDVVILTSIEHDHIDIYPDPAVYEAQFKAMVERIPEAGFLVADARDPLVRRVAAYAKCEVAFYAVEGDDTAEVTPTWLATPAGVASSALESGTGLRTPTFDVFASGTSCGRFTLDIPGRHNVRNALASIAACVTGFRVPLEEARRAIAQFQGVRRRQDLVNTRDGIFVYDDFAHHPTAVRETLCALRDRHVLGRLFVAFEARSATAVRSLHQVEYERAFDSADRVFLAPLGRANIPEAERLDLARLARGIGDRATLASHEEILAALASEAKADDVVLFLSNGAFGGIVRTFAHGGKTT